MTGNSLDPLSARLQALRLSSGFVLAGFLFNAGIVVLAVATLTGSAVYALVAMALMALLVGGLALFADTFLLNRVGARPLDAQEFPWLEPMVRELAASAGMPIPNVLIADTEVPNAFTVGLGNSGRILFTTGLLDRLPQQEVRAVAAHELGHVINRDVSLGVWAWAISSWVATVSSVVSLVASAVMAFFRILPSTASEGEANGFIGLGLLMIGLIGLAIGWLLRLAVQAWSLASRLGQLAFSREREFLADATGAAITRDPRSLAAALATLAEAPALPAGSAMVGRFCIVTPAARGGGWDELLSTHPSTEKRIEALRKLRADELPVLDADWQGVGSVNWLLPAASGVLLFVMALVIPAVV